MYMVIVIITNMKIAFKTHNHTWIGTSIIVGSVLSFYLWYEIENAAKGYWPLYHTWNQMFSRANAYWISMFLIAVNYAQFLLQYWYEVWSKQKSENFK